MTNFPAQPAAVHSQTFLLYGLQHDYLDAKTEYALIARAKNQNKDAVEELLRHNEKLIYKIALRFYRAGVCGDNELVDLQQFGRMGFMKAVQKFNLDSGNRLSTYATWWVMQGISRGGISSGAKLGISFRDNEIRAKLVKGRALLESRLGRECTNKELSEYTDVPEDMVEHLLWFNFVSLDEPSENGGENLVALRLADTSVDVEETSMDLALIEKVKTIVLTLPKSWQTVINLRFGLTGKEPQSYSQIAAALKITRQRVDQIENSAMTTIREALR